MKILMIGNGFDLYHKLPTTYLCFLKTVEYIIDNESIPLAIGAVFIKQKSECSDIKNSMDAYGDFYNNYFFSEDEKKELAHIKARMTSNYWLKYFLNSYNKDVGWIDFEKQISFVLDNFLSIFETEYLFNQAKERVHYLGPNYTVEQFDFFIGQCEQRYVNIKEKYLCETPYGSNKYSVNIDAIFETLYKELCELSEALKTYLKLFVEKPLIEMKKENIVDINSVFFNFDNIISFNYTNTYKTLYDDTYMFCIHGKLDENIILGVNPDKNDEFSNDELSKIDTSYIMFKKYYQRVYYRTDNSFINLIKDVKNLRKGLTHEKNTLVVCGHSLDKTDEDIIKEAFNISDRIYVVCHKLENIGNYVTNLIHIYGKSEFDRIRSEKQLEFITYDEWNEVDYEDHYMESLI